MIEIRIVKEIVSRKFYKYLKIFEKKKSERMLIKKTCIEFIRENLIVFLVQVVYLINTKLIVYTRLYLTYSKSYIFYIKPTCGNHAIIISLIYSYHNYEY